jgi:hypothetical protein
VATKGGRSATALHRAAYHGHVEICRVLLAAGAEVDARTDRGLSDLKRWIHGAWGRFQGVKKNRAQHVNERFVRFWWVW